MIIRRYSELEQIDTFEARYEYLRIGGQVGESTFGFDRHLNQGLYHSREWKDVRREVIIRDNGCDLGMADYGIHHAMLVHHMNPISPDDIMDRNVDILDPRFLITTTTETHNAIHYGNRSLLKVDYVPRSGGDTNLW